MVPTRKAGGTQEYLSFLFFSEVLGVRGVEEVISHLVEMRKMSIFGH